LDSKVILQQRRKCIQNELRLQLFVDHVVLKIIMLKDILQQSIKMDLEGLKQKKKKKTHHQVEMLEINITTWPTL
jgi:hypothetical protein